MPIKNYTTVISAMKSVGEIQGNLVTHGARAIMVDYSGDGVPASLSFIIPTSQGDITFRLPAHVKKVENILLTMRSRPLESWQADYAKTLDRIQKQAARVAWRIIKDWVAAQVAIIETEMVTLTEVFLPYMQVRGQQTLYEAMVSSQFQLEAGKGETEK